MRHNNGTALLDSKKHSQKTVFFKFHHYATFIVIITMHANHAKWSLNCIKKKVETKNCVEIAKLNQDCFLGAPALKLVLLKLLTLEIIFLS